MANGCLSLKDRKMSVCQEGKGYYPRGEEFGSSDISGGAYLDEALIGESFSACCSWLEQETNAEVEFRKRFFHLAEKWEMETINLSSAQEIVLNSAYQQIIGMGPDIIRLILERLKAKPDFWFWALYALTGENPVPEEARGDLKAMAEAWFDWGKQSGYC